jgi:hypothetical protein
LLLAGTSLATAKSRGAAGAHGKPFHPGINETTSRPTAADPYHRLADPYYGGYSDTSRPTVADPYYRLSDWRPSFSQKMKRGGPRSTWPSCRS